MPNTPALIGLGVSGLCAGAHASNEDLKTARILFEAVGLVEIFPESMMDSVTALTGSGPAYVFHLMECLVEAGVAQGFDRQQALMMVLQLVKGSAELASRSPDKSPADLRKAVTSKGGTTAAALAVLEEANVREAYVRCVEAARARGVELSRQS